MSDTPFSNREIVEKFDDIKQDLTDIKAQTTKTNGRVSALEKWQNVAIGGLAVLSAVAFPLLTWALITLVNLPKV